MSDMATLMNQKIHRSAGFCQWSSIWDKFHILRKKIGNILEQFMRCRHPAANNDGWNGSPPKQIDMVQTGCSKGTNIGSEEPLT